MSDATLSRAADVSLKGHPGPQDEPSVICCLLPYRLIVQKRGGDYVVEPNQFITFRSIALEVDEMAKCETRSQQFTNIFKLS